MVDPTNPVAYDRTVTDRVGKPHDNWYEQLDESLAIMGVIAIAVLALFICDSQAGTQIANTVAGGLIGYVGRGRKNGN